MFQQNKQTNLDFPDAAGRAPEKQFCFSPEGADTPYETYFPIACTTVPCLQPIGLAKKCSGRSVRDLPKVTMVKLLTFFFALFSA